MARSTFKFPYLLTLALIPACSGGGCSSCGGVTPLPGGFINEERIENAAALRITQSGFDFLEDNVGLLAANLLGSGANQGVLSFEVPTSTSSAVGISYTVCPGGADAAANPPKCVAEIDLANADLSVQPSAPHNVVISGTVPLRLQNLPLDTGLGDIVITLNNNEACPSENQEFAPIGATINLSVETDLDPAHARQGYSKIAISEVTISQSDIEDAISLDCGGGILGFLADALKGIIVGQLFGGLQDTLVSSVEEQLCQKAAVDVNPPCPTNTTNVDGICRYGNTADAACVSMVLGTDGHANLAGLLQAISPGTKGGMDFLLASGGSSQRDDASGFTWGDLNPANNGATLGMMGGVEPNPISGCVPLSSLPRPAGLKIPNELIDDSLVTGWPNAAGPHLGIGISESFFNYALSGMYNSGLLCIGFSTETLDLLNSGTLGLLAQSLRDLGIQRETQPIAIVLKPTKPPHVTFGQGTNLTTDPLIRLQLEQAGFDFYMFSSDRYIRFMTATFDIDAPINLTVTPEGLIPVLDTLSIENGVVDNASLLKEDPAAIAASLQGLLSSQIGGLIGSGLPALDLNGATASLGLQLVIPESVEGQGSPGLRTLEKDGERYLSIFAELQVADAMAAQANAMETSSSIDSASIDPYGLARVENASTITPDNAPEVVVLAGVVDDHGKAVEHQVRVDGGMWKPWTQNRYIHVRDNSLRIEGRHEIEVRSRAVGDAYSLDATPDVHEILVDTVAPEVRVSTVTESNQTKLDIREIVSADRTMVRYRFDNGAFSEWMPSTSAEQLFVPEEAESIEVEVMDESGNVGTAQQELIRGLPHDAGDGGCGCVVPAAPERGSKWPLVLLGLGLLGLRSRSRSAKQLPAKKKLRSLGSVLTQSKTAQAVGIVTVMGIGGSFSGCSCDDDPTDPLANYKCEDPCVDLEPGLIGSYTGAAVDDGGTLWVSGYLEANYDSAFTAYGDLVVGKLDGDKVAWEIVDGVPLDPKPDGAVANLKGFRGGQTVAGDDVGIWSSVALDPVSGLPRVAYYDRTNKALKLASFNGTAWEIAVVQDDAVADIGKYAKLGYDGNTPVIAYMALEASEGPGFTRSSLRLARGTQTGFTFEDVAVNESTPCRNGFCGGGTQCVADLGVCANTGSSCGECADGESCVAVEGVDSCQVLLTSTKLDPYPVATGLYVSLAEIPGGGVGIAYYDRVVGTVNVAAKGGDGWESIVVDGGPQPDGTYSDVGVGTSLFIGADGVWHLAYVDGYNESLKHATVADGVVEGTELVDDGLSVNGVPNEDGQHVIGDDANVFVNAQGGVQITYQDATSGTLRAATRSDTGWSVKILQSDVFGGFFSRQVDVNGSLNVVHWGRQILDGKGVGDVSVVKL